MELAENGEKGRDDEEVALHGSIIGSKRRVWVACFPSYFPFPQSFANFSGT